MKQMHSLIFQKIIVDKWRTTHGEQYTIIDKCVIVVMYSIKI